MDVNDWQIAKEEFEKADAEAALRLKQKGIHNPRLKYLRWTAENYDEMKKYDQMLANEIVKIMKKPNSSYPENPDNSKNVRGSRTQNTNSLDWASSAYDR